MNVYLGKEIAYGPLASALDNVRYIEQMLRGTPDHVNFADYMQRLMTGLYKTDNSQWETTWTDVLTGPPWNTTDSEVGYDQLMFNNLVIETACFYGVPECLAEAKSRYAPWRALGKDQAFSPE